VRERIRVKYYSIQTEEAYVGWIKKFIFFHNKRHPAEMGKLEMEHFLTHLAIDKNVETTMIYTHVLNQGGRGVISPLEDL